MVTQTHYTHITSVDEFTEDTKKIHPKTGKKFPTKNLI
jgi:hypothetical protein